MRPGTDTIATFVEVVRKASLSAAARALGLPKSTVSRRLLRLEQTLGSKLLHRDARRVILTPAGRAFYASVVGAVDTLSAAVTSFEQARSEPRGTIRVTAPPDLGRMVLAPILVAFLERYPEIAVDLTLTTRVLDLVGEGLDVAVRAGRTLHGDLIARQLCEAELQLAASPALAQAAAGTSDLRGLERQPFVLHRAPDRSQTVKLERAAPKRGKPVELTVSGRISVDDYAAMAEIVAAGQGVGLMPAIHVRDGVAAGRLVRLFPEWSSRAAHVYLVTAGRQQPERVRLFADFLLAAFGRIERV